MMSKNKQRIHDKLKALRDEPLQPGLDEYWHGCVSADWLARNLGISLGTVKRWLSVLKDDHEVLELSHPRQGRFYLYRAKR